ncbi:MAG: redoxin family protein [Candidatus Eremiobacteraeota bacterium]|nr:redoxin family protein [Candidatus Eremiobacteraeota bacterium]
MNQRTLGVLSIVIIAVLVIGGVLYVKLRPSTQLQNASVAPINATAAIGQKAPEFQTPTTAGPFDLAATQKPVFLEVFATWCPHCQRETMVIDRLYQKYRDRVDFIAVPGSDTGMDGTSPESQFDVLNFQQRFRTQYPIAAYDPNLTIAKQYLKGGFPTLAVIDKNKTITYLNSGEVPYGELDAELAKVTR